MHDDTNEESGSGPADQPESEDTGSTTVRDNWKESDRPSVATVEAVAAATNREMTDLPPLHETIDASALDTLLNGQPSSVTISFRYADTAISMSGDGSIEVHVERNSREEDSG
mgnify:CR=1 FL=1